MSLCWAVRSKPECGRAPWNTVFWPPPLPFHINHKLRRPRRARRFRLPSVGVRNPQSCFVIFLWLSLLELLNLRHLAHSLHVPRYLLRAQRTRRRCCSGTSSHHRSLCSKTHAKRQEAACLNSSRVVRATKITKNTTASIHYCYANQPCPSTRNLLSTPSAEIHARRHHLP